MIGIGAPAFHNADSIPRFVQAGIRRPAGAAGQERLAAAVLSDGAPRTRVEIEEFVGAWLTLEPSERTSLGGGEQRPGRRLHAGASMYQRQRQVSRPRLTSQYRTFPAVSCRARRSRGEIADAIFLYIGARIRLGYGAGDSRPARSRRSRLGEAVQLGWTSWMAPNWSNTDETICAPTRGSMSSAALRNSVGARRRISEGTVMGADISVESVAGKLNSVGYEAFIQALRQAKTAGNRNIELGALAVPDPAEGQDRHRADRGPLQAQPRQAARRRDCRRQRLPQERDGDAGHLQPGRRRARPRLALRDAAVRRDADPHRPLAGGDAQVARAQARAGRRLAGVRQDPGRRTRRQPSRDLGGIGRGQSASDGRLGHRRGERGRRRPPRRAPRARPRSTASARTSPPRRSPGRWIRSSAATRKSARSSTC